MRVIAHRGASASWPEHTRAAYLQALSDGADGLECDVHLTADGVAVCWHDDTVDRTSDGTGPVHAHTLAELRALDVLRGAVPPPAWGGPRDQVLTLAELVGLALDAGRPVTLVIELKHPAPYGFAAERAVLDILADAGFHDGRLGSDGRVTVSLMSFHPGALRELARLGAPAHCLMPLLDAAEVAELVAHGVDAGVAAALVGDAVALADEVGGVGPSVAYLAAHPDRVTRWVAAGRVVRVWTVSTAADVEACLALGVTEVTTDDPARTAGLLR
ncbi:glycerophosphodiester phosphodiesterase family protein [Actinotalea sp. M2MS4P-6]|uniref:glycerophosphodiester phosphodiesterase n=1 Tax=Actinotalea sp. M2MS4P-6 TaxID=2983762 RepID=UPI0021E50B43|nr:glycerophosphodiester phosphodiesterase family protein [Actinotalea sp. M2MS4P-6]MCV2396307.1 glycerophosphodiester phosphodiesterase family protein [Actinotalea sp. M2MS4P-6]